MDGLSTWAVVWSTDQACVLLNHFFKDSPFIGTTLPYSLALLGTASPLLLAEDDALFRAVLSLASVFYFIKVREVLLEPRFLHEPLLTKFCSVGVTFFDISDRTPNTSKTSRWPRLAAHLARLGLHAALQHACLVAFQRRHEVFSSSPLLRTQFACTAMCLHFFLGLHIFSDALRANLVLLFPDEDYPSLMDAPHHATTVRDFWKRWNLVIQSLLHKYVYKPVRRLGWSQSSAVTLTFLTSGAVHVWPILAASLANWPAALEMMAYFVYQLGAIALESKVLPLVLPPEEEDSSSRVWMSRAWTLLHLFGPSYLLIHPGMVLAQVDF